MDIQANKNWFLADTFADIMQLGPIHDQGVRYSTRPKKVYSGRYFAKELLQKKFSSSMAFKNALGIVPDGHITYLNLIVGILSYFTDQLRVNIQQVTVMRIGNTWSAIQHIFVCVIPGKGLVHPKDNPCKVIFLGKTKKLMKILLVDPPH